MNFLFADDDSIQNTCAADSFPLKCSPANCKGKNEQDG